MDRNDVIHIAYAEDHVSVREGIAASLQKSHGIKVIVDIQANNGVEMLDQLTTAKHLPDICLLDYNMPKMNGLELLIEIKKRWPRMRILVLTVFDDDSYIVQMIKNGANGYLTKKSSTGEIKEALQSIYKTGYYYSEIADLNKFTSVLSGQEKPIRFTEDEMTLIKYMVTNMKYKDIAKKMNNTLSGIKGCSYRVFKKANVNNRTALAVYAIKNGLILIDNSDPKNNTK